MTIALPPWLAIALTLLICGAGLWKGAWEERGAATAMLCSIVITVFLRDNSWPVLQRGALVADTLLFAALLAVALRTTRYWPLAAAGFQLLSVLTHIAKLLDDQLQQWAYMTAQVIWTWLVLGSIAVGTINAVRLRRRYPATERPAPAGATRR